MFDQPNYYLIFVNSPRWIPRKAIKVWWCASACILLDKIIKLIASSWYYQVLSSRLVWSTPHRFSLFVLSSPPIHRSVSPIISRLNVLITVSFSNFINCANRLCEPTKFRMQKFDRERERESERGERERERSCLPKNIRKCAHTPDSRNRVYLIDTIRVQTKFYSIEVIFVDCAI